MKYLSIILALYILMLSLLPCGDTVKILEDITTIEKLALEEDHHQHSNNCNDDPCSPICGCSCCSIVMDFPTKTGIGLVIPPTPSLQLPNSFNSDLGILSTFFIWQPPKYS